MFASLRGQGERFLGLTGLMAGGFLGLTALQAGGCGGGFAADYKISVTGFIFSVIWHDKHSADWLAALATPFRLRRTSPFAGGQNRFLCFPAETWPHG